MSEFFAYDHIKELRRLLRVWLDRRHVHLWIRLADRHGVKALIQTLKKRFGKNHSEEETVNE
jgi:hypothetical protein